VTPRGTGICGSGGLCTVNFASLRDEFTHIGIFDINPKVGLFWVEIVKILTEEGLTRITAREKIDTYLKFYPAAKDALDYEITHNLSFLSTDERFERIRKLLLLRKFSFTRMDLYNPKAVGAFLKAHHDRGETFHTFYLSNIAAFTCSKKAYGAFEGEGLGGDYARYSGLGQSLALLPKEAIVIDAKKKADTDVVYTQRIHLKPEKPLRPTPCECAFGQAVMSDIYDDVQTCVTNGVSLSTVREEDGHTILMVALANGKNNSVRVLLESNANVHATDKLGLAALHHAVQYGNMRGIELLLLAKADVGARSIRLVTPLHAAAALGQTAVATLLIQNGADREARDDRNNTPFKLTELQNFPAYTLRTSDPGAYRALRWALTPGAPVPAKAAPAPTAAAAAGGPVPGSATSSSSSSSSSGTASASRVRSDRKAPKK